MRVCKYKKCDKNIDHLPENHRYCTLAHRNKHHEEEYCKNHKKLRECVACGELYDYMKRDKKQTCSDKCELILKNKVRVKEDTVCQRCGIIVPKSRCYCRRCEVVVIALDMFKIQMK